MGNAAKVVSLRDEPTEVTYLRAKYLQSLEKELEGWVAKTQEAFYAGFSSRGKYSRWEDAFDEWIKKRREP